MNTLSPQFLKYVEAITLNFDGCIVKIAKSEEPGKYSINIDSGNIEFDGIFDTEYGYVAYVDLPYRISHNEKYTGNSEYAYIYEKYDKYDWFIYSKLSNGCKYFSNGDIFNIEDVNVILKNIEYGIDFIDFVKKNTIGKDAWVDIKYWSAFLSGEYKREVGK